MGAVGIADRVAGDDEEPRQRVPRHLLEAAPGNEERLGEHLGGRVRVDLAQRVGMNAPGVGLPEALEPLGGGRGLRRLRFAVGVVVRLG